MNPAPPRCFNVFLIVTVLILVLINVPLDAAETDSSIENAARNSFVFRTYLTGDSIAAQSKDGVVTLTGTVADDSHKVLAADTVAGLAGVKSVKNEIVVKDPAEKDSDAWLYVKVKSALAYHRNVSAYNTKAAVKDGVVTLTGEASSLAQKELTTEYVQDVAGIKEVKNEMTVAAAAKKEASVEEIIDDASIMAQVKIALLTHRSTNAFRTTVTATAGVVTIGGTARNTAEKDLVTKLATDIHGVKSVVNTMIIEKAVTITN